MQRVLNILRINTPPHGKFKSHSLRIGAHIEQVILGLPLEARMSRFGWGHASNSMVSIYLDRTILFINSRYLLFGAPIPTSGTSSVNASRELHEA